MKADESGGDVLPGLGAKKKWYDQSVSKLVNSVYINSVLNSCVHV